MVAEISGGEVAKLACPICKSENVWKDGIRDNVSGRVQRYQCKDCDTKFCESAVLSNSSDSNTPRQVCDILAESKNLIVVQGNRTTGDYEKFSDILANYLLYLRKQPKKESTISGYMNCICSLINNSVDLYNPESLKEYLVSLEASDGRKRNIVHAYKHLYQLFFNECWRDAPRYRRVKKPQYLPTEKHLIQIISGVPNKYKPFCQLLYETATRSIEAWLLKWSDVDFEKGLVDITPVKNGEFRTLPISENLRQMMNMLPRDTEYIFKKGRLDHFREGFRKHRKRLATELNEPEINECSFKTFRTFAATKWSYMYEMNEVQYRLGHTQISTTQKYVRRSLSMNREYLSHVTRTIEESQQAIENGYEYVASMEGVMLWRKPK